MNRPRITEVYIVIKYDKKKVNKVFGNSKKLMDFLESAITVLNKGGNFIIITLVDRNNKTELTKLKNERKIGKLPALVCPAYKKKLYGFTTIKAYLTTLMKTSHARNQLISDDEEIRMYHMEQMRGDADDVDDKKTMGNVILETTRQCHERKEKFNNKNIRGRYGRIFDENQNQNQEPRNEAPTNRGSYNPGRAESSKVHVEEASPQEIAKAMGGDDADLLSGFWEAQSETKL